MNNRDRQPSGAPMGVSKGNCQVDTPELTAAIGDRRSGEDRRRQHVKAFFYQFVNPRRKNRKRRATDSQIYFVDFHEPRLIMVVVPILLLCIIDTYATLILVNHGGGEFNPFMELLINANVWLFYVIKYLLTATAVLVLLSYRRFLFFGLTGLHTLYGTLVVYITLIGYHAVGLLSVPPG